jgi:arylsulfatase A-like enzyme
MTRSARLLVLITATALTGCGAEDEPASPIAAEPPKPNRLNVLWVLLDTLRQDAVGCYGASRPDATPVLDGLAAAGTLFENARSSSSKTLPAHASMFSSQFPHQHGAVTREFRLGGDATTLAEVLRDAGWDTAAVTDGGFLMPSFGVLQGFDRIDTPALTFRGREFVGTQRGKGARPVTAAAARWLRERQERGEERPFFLFVHTYEVHSPYDPPARWRERMVGEYRGPLGKTLKHGQLHKLDRKGELTDADRQYARDLYAAEVAEADMRVGELLEALRGTGEWDTTLVIVTSDHGESFGEHGQWGHGDTLYDTLLKVPLLLHHPQRFSGGTRVADPVRLEDLAPTVLELAGLPAPADWVGVSLTDPAAPRDLLSSITPRDPSVEVDDPSSLPAAFGLCADGRKSIHYEEGCRFDDGPDNEIFDLTADPDELHNLWTEAATEALLELLARVRARYPASGAAAPGDHEASVSPSELEDLRGLGYVK